MKTKEITLTITQRTTYTRTFDMDEKVYLEIQNKLRELHGHELSKYEERVAEKYIDFADNWFDADDTEIIFFGEDK